MSAVVRVRPTVRQWVGLIVVPPGFAAAGYALGRSLGVAIAIWQVWLFVAAVFAAFILAAALRASEDRSPRLRQAAVAEPGSRPFTQAVRWEDRLSWSESDTDRFNTTVRERMVPVVAERLRLRHRVDWYTEPHRSRQLLPEELYRLLSEPVAAPLSESEMDTIVSQIESLSSEDRVNAERY